MSTKRSQYEELIIESNDGARTVDIRLGTASIDYYEDVFSPTITAKIIVASNGTITYSDNDSDDKNTGKYKYTTLVMIVELTSILEI